jgi:hypothetical protein
LEEGIQTMTTRRCGWILVCLLLLRVQPAWGQAQVQPTANPTQGVPAELRPLLLPPQSEMRLVTLRYSADRGTLNGNYVAGGRGGGRGGSGSEPALVSLSTSRIARLCVSTWTGRPRCRRSMRAG